MNFPCGAIPRSSQGGSPPCLFPSPGGGEDTGSVVSGGFHPPHAAWVPCTPTCWPLLASDPTEPPAPHSNLDWNLC